MSTNSTISIKLKEEDRNRDLQSPNGGIINPEGKQYLSVYCHWDGYISGVGYDLLNKNFTYEECLNFILMGDRSTCDECYVSRGESWEDDKPEASDNPCHEYYSYVFQDDEWYWIKDGDEYIKVSECNEDD